MRVLLANVLSGSYLAQALCNFGACYWWGRG